MGGLPDGDAAFSGANVGRGLAVRVGASDGLVFKDAFLCLRWWSLPGLHFTEGMLHSTLVDPRSARTECGTLGQRMLKCDGS